MKNITNLLQKNLKYTQNQLSKTSLKNTSQNSLIKYQDYNYNKLNQKINFAAHHNYQHHHHHNCNHPQQSNQQQQQSNQQYNSRFSDEAILNPRQSKREQNDLACNNCQAKNFKRNKFICGSCKTLLEPERKLYQTNFYELFEMPKSFEIDQQFLEQRYKELIQNFHPDRFYAINNGEQVKDSESYSAYLIQGYETLKDDYNRAEYYINLMTDLETEEAEIELQDFEFLENLMELREEITDSQKIEQLQQIKEKVQSDKKQTVDKISQLFKQKKFEDSLQKLKILKYHYSTLNLIEKQEEMILFQ